MVVEPKRIFQRMKNCRSFSTKVQEKVKKVIKTNAFLVHLENPFLSTVADNMQHVQKQRARRVDFYLKK